MDQSINDNKPLSVGRCVLVCLILLVVLVETPIWLKIHRHQFHNYDLGIYAQALHRIEWGNLNPYLTVRDVNIFNDHFDPILLIAVPFAKVWTPAYVGAAFDVLFVLAAALVMLAFTRRRGLPAALGLMSLVYLLFNRGTISSLMIPFHPTTWAILPMTMLVLAMLRGHKGWIFVALTFLFLCKEEYPFVGIMVGAGCFLKRERRFALLVLLWSGLWILFDFGIRPHSFGVETNHALRVFDPLMTDPSARLLELLAEINVQRLIAIAVPLVPLAIVMFRLGVRIRWDILLLLVPLLGIRFLGGVWRHHYFAVVAPILLGMFDLFQTPHGVPDDRSMRRALAWCVLLLAITNAVPIKRNIRTLAGTFGLGREAVDPARLVAIEESMTWLKSNKEGRALVQGNLLPRLVERPEIYQVRGRRPEDVEHFDLVFVEKPPGGDPWPTEYEVYEQLIERWRAEASEVIRDDDHVFLARGWFWDREDG